MKIFKVNESIADLFREKAETKPKIFKCYIHPDQEVEYFCHYENMLVCNKCTFEHAGHHELTESVHPKKLQDQSEKLYSKLDTLEPEIFNVKNGL
jgi:hypothetical protein